MQWTGQSTDWFPPPPPSGHICVWFRSKHIPKTWKKCQSTRQIKWLENAENKTIIHEMESAKLTSNHLLMPSMYPEEVYSIHPLAKPAPLSGPGERRRANLPASVSLYHLSLGCFMQTMCRVSVFEGTFHSGLKQPSCSYAGKEVAFHFVMYSCSWASEKSDFHAFWSAAVV